MATMHGYGQFCPVAKAADIFAQRWTPLILRELLMGSHRFNDLQRGLSRISRSLLLQRLRALEQADIVERHAGTGPRTSGYYLTPAGRELFDVVRCLGEWGQRWVNHDIGPEDVDPDLLMWDMHRRIHVDLLPERRVIAQFDFYGVRSGTYWLVLEPPDPSVCYQDPGLDVDVLVTADTLTMHRVWIGRLPFAEALKRGLITLEGPRELIRQLPAWLALSFFASVPSAMESS